jgi:hypothetical protein
MAHMTAQELIAKCARDLDADPVSLDGVTADSSSAAQPGRPRIEINCNQKLPSCRRWVALRLAQLDRNLARIQSRSSVHSVQTATFSAGASTLQCAFVIWPGPHA